jgi:hypothetical protein
MEMKSYLIKYDTYKQTVLNIDILIIYSHRKQRHSV